MGEVLQPLASEVDQVVNLIEKVLSFVVTQQSMGNARDRLGVGWEGYHENRRCSRDTYQELYITKYTSIRREKATP